ncbi:MAG: hypothetical protein M3M91_05420 [Thermoproteota archaeon]|nr:hypothetical protein [Thermoproteota archaeon]
MTIIKIRIIATITALLIIATATTMTGFPSVTPVLATPVTLGTTEQTANDTATDTTITSPTTGQEQQTIHITKDGTNSYVISGGSSSIGSFDTTYRIVGERSAVRASEDLIITTLTVDYSISPTIGYVSVGNMTATATGGTANTGATLPNPFASPEQITERITSDLRRVISEAENNTPQGQLVEINCDFGMTLDDMHCQSTPLVGAEEAGNTAATTSTNATASISP